LTKHEKKRAAVELVRLRRKFAFVGLSDKPPAQLRELRERHLERFREELAQLYAEHFSEEQLQAQLAFYGSDIGKAVIETESEITKHLEERMREIAAELNEEASKSGGPMRGFFQQSRGDPNA
jgi:hypothetical protein